MFLRFSAAIVMACWFSCSMDRQNQKPVTAESSASNVSRLTVVDLVDTSRLETVYTFPIISIDGGDEAAAKINHTLQKAELELEVGEQDSSVFENIWPSAEAPFSGVTAFEYRVVENSSRIFSIEFIKEACGAYCEGFSTYYNFDARTGELLTLEKILSESGFKQLRKQIIEERRALVASTIANADSTEEGEAMKEMYTQCLDYVTEEYFSKSGFYIDNGKIVFLSSRCSSHAQLAIDEIGDFEDTKLVDEISTHLNSYGKSLLYD